jgi:hypothetical protein
MDRADLGEARAPSTLIGEDRKFGEGPNLRGEALGQPLEHPAGQDGLPADLSQKDGHRPWRLQRGDVRVEDEAINGAVRRMAQSVPETPRSASRSGW